jgi:hypothetical protein
MANSFEANVRPVKEGRQLPKIGAVKGAVIVEDRSMVIGVLLNSGGV